MTSTFLFGEKTLTDVVKGIRASKRDTVLYISQCIAECKTELSSRDMYVKANALQKLTFLQMMGYSMSPWASFATVEVMSSPRFAHKRIGYLAASQGFTQDTEVILLTTNLLKKELRGASAVGAVSITNPMQAIYEAGLAINCIANIVTEDLARDLLPELTLLSQHSHPYLRKKAILCLFKVFCKYPQGLRLTFARLQASLQDANPAAVSCAVNVITELSDKNPNNYLHLAPAFFTLLTTSTNNWMLIKVVKLLGSLVPCEPRLARKLLEPLAGIVQHTQAKSLLYEAVYTITLCLPYCAKSNGEMPAMVPEIVTLCATTLKSFLQEADQNLKYLGLVGFASLLQSHPKVLSLAPEYKPLILACLSDQDVTIRTRALELLHGVATRKNLPELISQLLQHTEFAATGRYKQDLVRKIMQLCSGEKYSLLQDFAWYFDVLLQLGRLQDLQHHHRHPNNNVEYMATQLCQVPLRVLPVRTHCVKRSMMILFEGTAAAVEVVAGMTTSTRGGGDVNSNTSWMNGITTGAGGTGAQDDNGRGKMVMPQLLPSLAWIVGEYSDLIPRALIEIEESAEENGENVLVFDESTRGPYHALVQVLTTPHNVSKLSSETQVVYLQAAMKVLAVAAGGVVSSSGSSKVKNAELTAMVQTIATNLPIYMQSTTVQVVERSFTAMQLLKSLHLVPDDGSALSLLPGLSALQKDENDDDSSDDSSSDGKQATTNKNATGGSGDLLNLGAAAAAGSSGATAATTTNTMSTGLGIMSAPATTLTAKSLPARLRQAAPTLDYIFKPSPMKPLGAKTQRKKLNTRIGHSVDLDAPIDFTVFQDFIDEEMAYLSQTHINMESISFTQQHVVPAKEQAPVSMGAPSSFSAAGMTGFGGGGGGGGFAEMTSNRNEGTSFQNTIGAAAVGAAASTGSNPQQRQHDPFYLDSGGGNAAAAGGAADPASRFGTIQLLDDDDDDGVDDKVAGQSANRTKPSKKKKAKRSKRGSAASVTTSGGLLSFGEGTGSNTAPASIGGSAATPAVYDSDEEEDDDTNFRPSPSRADRKTKRTNKEFVGLAKVDLTTPLREDEVMPERKHRVVPDNPARNISTVVAAPQQEARSKSEKKLKKEKKHASKKKATASEVDLLDLGGFSICDPPVPAPLPSAATQVAAPVMAGSKNPINSAFDDLLGLAAPAPAPALGGGDFAGMQLPAAPSQSGFTDVGSSPATTAKGTRPWMKASIKLSSASGSPALDWSKVSLLYRVSRTSQGGGVSGMVVFRVVNGHSAASIDGLVLELKGQGSTTFGTVGPGSSTETNKVGPFAFPIADVAPELKGTLRSASGSSVSVKVPLPVSVHLAPQENLPLDQVAEELSNQGWSSHSVKLESSSALLPDSVKQVVGSFLRAAAVIENSPSNSNCTFAAVSTSGARVRVLVKVKGSSVKIDVRCTNSSLGQTLASDLKKLVL
jgi:AP-3 complex subunit delta